ncbi:hypothetical protein BT96DRAFT_960009 [Gymnopus androsaceus JB14]|uniref:Uncharacterized protein n=1 Tax=Gymnopus androsaceus JB14 TaxID=1447944 RepID=A0A6A4GV08_9AGAR|nr:hypothetical protein BT96DRAFT_960009 [Gymnopus androsaceus JB14]
MEDDVAGGDYNPFWKGFPFCDIHDAITPDVLHQLYQGVIKHLIAWIQSLMTEDEFDFRLQSLPPAFGVRHFKGGISSLSQVTGPERKNLAKILIACLVGKIDSRGIIATHSLLDFILLAQYPSHDGRTLTNMTQALDSWHAKREFFEEKEVRKNFNIPKFHSLLHYVPSIQMQGTTDNGNTEAFEHLHITFAKDGWRAITVVNGDEEVVPENNSKVNFGIQLAKRAPEPNKPIVTIARDHHAPTFITSLKLFLNGLHPKPQSRTDALKTPLPFDSLNVWHQVKIAPLSLFEDEELSETVKALPIWKHSEISHFDTVLVLDSNAGESTGVAGKKK